MKEEHKGYAITLEVIATLAIMCLFLNCILYVLRVTNVQRYMNTVLTSTAANAARWGGVDTEAYRANISNTPLLTEAQNKLNNIETNGADGKNPFNAKITGYPNVITSKNDYITLTINYSFPSFFKTIADSVEDNGSFFIKNMEMSVRVKSIMKAGKLL